MQEELLSTQHSCLSPSRQMGQIKVSASVMSTLSLALALLVAWPECSLGSLATGWLTSWTKASSKLSYFSQEYFLK